MRKLSLLLSILLSFVCMISLAHASSGDITVWTKTYTLSEAQKQIVEPLLKRIEKQKIAKIKIRLVNLAIRQYTNKQKIAQKQGKIDLAKFYSGIIDTLNGKMNTANTGSTNSFTWSQGIWQIKKTNIETTWGSTIWGTSTNDYNGMTQAEIEQSRIRQNVNTTFELTKSYWVTQSQFLNEVAKNYPIGSYGYNYAQTLNVGNSSSRYNANHGGIWTTSNQTGLTGKALEESTIIGEVTTSYNNAIIMGFTKSQFLSFMREDYGETGYGYQYAQTLSFPSDEVQQKKMKEYKEKEQAKNLIDEKYQTVYLVNLIKLRKWKKEARRIFLAEIQKLYWTTSYAYQYADSISK